MKHLMLRTPSLKEKQRPMFHLKKLHSEQMFVLVRMQLRNHADTQLLKRFKREKGYVNI